MEIKKKGSVSKADSSTLEGTMRYQCLRYHDLNVYEDIYLTKKLPFRLTWDWQKPEICITFLC